MKEQRDRGATTPHPDPLPPGGEGDAALPSASRVEAALPVGGERVIGPRQGLPRLWGRESVRSAGAGWLLTVALALPLVVYAWIGSYARYTADDYCWAGVLRTEGFWHAQVHWYTDYSPRYAFTFVVNLVELAGPAIVPALPLVAILVWLATLSWTFLQFRLKALCAVALAEVAALATLQTAPDLPQSLYWQTGMLTYLLPLVLATFLVGWVRVTRRGWALAISALVTFSAGGLSETYLIPQNVALTLALLASLVLARRQKTTQAHLAAALFGGVLALVFILAAPATTSRIAGTPADLWLALSASVATAAYQAQHLARYFPFTVLVCLALPGLLGASAAHVDRRLVVAVTVGVAITLPFCYFPSFYAQNGNPPARSLIVPGAILIAYVLFLGYAFGSVWQRVPEPRRLAVSLALLLVPIGVAVLSLPEPAVAAQHAALWDAEDQQIRASRDSGQADVTVQPLPAYLGEDFVTPDSDNWFNLCVARYYGLQSIAATAAQ
jgi:hypothetical protein